MRNILNILFGLVTGARCPDSVGPDVGISAQDEGDQEGFSHLLGEYEVPDAERVIKGLERQEIPFEIESHDEIQNARSKGSNGRWTKLKVWINGKHQAEAERVQAEALNIQV